MESDLNDDDKAAVLEAVDFHVRAGFLSAEEIVEAVDETVLEPGEVDQKWLSARVDEAMVAQRAAEAEWPERTDCDRLDDLFESLNNQGIIALQNAGYTQSDGISDVSERYEDLGGKSSAVTGYCFYHGQDLERVVESGELWLTFGAIDGDDAKGVAIGQRVKAAAEKTEFDVEWDGTIGTRILLRNVTWQRRRSSPE